MSEQTSDLIEITKNGTSEQLRSAISSASNIDFQDKYGFTALMYAATKPTDDKIRILLQAGAKTTMRARDGRTILTVWAHADSSSSGKVLQALLEAGVDINESDKFSRTTLMWATRYGKAEVVEALIKAGADINKVDAEGATPLILASRYRNEKDFNNAILEILADAGSSINARDSNGMTPLMWAARSQDPIPKIAFLLKKGADLDQKSRIGRSALDYAYRNLRIKNAEFKSLEITMRPKERKAKTTSELERQDRFVRSILITIIFIVNFGAAAFWIVLGLPSDMGIWLNLISVGFAVGLMVNPIRLLVLLIADRTRSRRKVIDSRRSATSETWNQVLVQTGIVGFLEVAIGVNWPLWKIFDHEPNGRLLLIAELVILGIVMYLKKRWLGSISDAIERVVE